MFLLHIFIKVGATAVQTNISEVKNFPQHTAKLYEHLIHGGNYTGVSFKQVLDDVSWVEATTKVGSLNTIATLVYHIQYYANAVAKVLEGEPLKASDALSYQHAPVTSEEDWNALLHKTWRETDNFTTLVAELPEATLLSSFEKYGTYYRNIHGVIEHTHYHLGQISLLKKMIRQGM